MGLSYNLIFIDNKENKITQQELLKDIGSEGQIKFDKVDFDFLYKETHLTEKPYWGISHTKDWLIISDENHIITEFILSEYKTKTPILQLESGGSTGVTILSYWENGILVRKLSQGKDQFTAMYEAMKNQIPNDVYKDLIKGDKDFGPIQWFEKEGNNHDNIIHSLLEKSDKTAISIWELKWEMISE
jgi:hypothetical protein